MIRVNFVEPQTTPWTRWKAACAHELERIKEAVARGGLAPPVTNLYKKQKAALCKGYYGKCIFCEKRITSTQWGDVEHYRPKAGVQEEDWTPVRLTRGGRCGAHPGYWWLAYDCQNLLFSCVLCNQVAKGRAYGKGVRFPVVGFRAEEPGEEEQETPLLLNPCQDQPEEHIRFDETGICMPVGNSEKGRVTRDIIGLNKRDLPQERAARFGLVKTSVNYLLATRPPEWLQEIDKLQAPEAEFSAIGRAAVRQVLAEVLPLQKIVKPGVE